MEKIIEELWDEYEMFKGSALTKAEKGQYDEAARYENIALGIYMARKKLVDAIEKEVTA